MSFESAHIASETALPAQPEGYSLERARAEQVQLHQAADEYVDHPHHDEASVHPMTPQQSVKAIADHLDGLVQRVTEAHYTHKRALEDKETYQGSDRQFAAELYTMVELAERHLTTEQATIAAFIHRFRDVIVES